jgi:PilZ domain
MPFRESRRSTRVPLKVAIAVESATESLTCEGETIVVNLHGALLSTTIRLSVGMRISIHVCMTDKRAKARVVYADPENPLRCGIELDQPRNIWGVPLPPDNWDETAALHSQ